MVFDNGLCVLFQPNAHTSTVAISALVEVSASRESWLTAGSRYVLALMAGSPGQDSGETGGGPTVLHIDSATTRDHVGLLVQCLPQDFPDALRLVQRQLFAPDLSAERLKAARREALAAIRRTRGLPVALALSTLVEELYPQQPGAWPVHGTIASMSALDLAQIRRFHRDTFRANTTILSISGDLARSEVERQVQDCFGELLPGEPRDREVFLPHPAVRGPRRLIMYGVDTSVVAVGARAPSLADADYPAAVVLSALLGSGMGSRLFQALRAQQSLAYTVEAALTPSRVCSHSYVLATCSPDDLDAVHTEISNQLDSIIAHGVSDLELARAQRFVTNSFMLNKQRNRDLAHYLGVFYGSGGPAGLRAYQQFPALIAEVSGEQVRESCAEMFARPATVIVEGTKR